MSEKLEFELNVKNNQLDPALSSGVKKSENLQDALNTALGVFAGGAALKGFELLGDAINAGIDFAKESVQAYALQEESLNRLSQALRASGDASAASLDDLSSFSEQLESTSKQTGEAITNQLAFAKSLGLSNSGTKELVLAAANLSATFGGSLESNVQALGRALDGNIRGIGNLIPEIKKLTEEQLANGEAAAIINEKFGGAAASELDTYTGRVHQLGNAFEEVQKQVGGLIANSDTVKESQGALTFIFQQITEAIRDWRIESERQTEGFKESVSSLDQLKRKYDELRVAAIDAEQIILNPSMFDTLLARPLAAADNLKRLNAEIAETKTLIESAEASLNKTTETKQDTARPPSDEILNARAQLNAEILALDQQLLLEQSTMDEAQRIAKIESDSVRQQEDLQRMTDFALAKSELDFQLKQDEILRTKSGEDERLALLKLSGEKELAQAKIKNDGLLKMANATRDAEKKAAQARVQLNETTAAEINAGLSIGADVASSIVKKGGKEQFIISKAAALGQAAVAMWLAVAKANALGPPQSIPAIAQAKLTGATAISGIVASALAGFEQGGVIGTSSIGATTGGDNTIVKARKGEMVLNAEQQKTLFDWINNGGMSGDVNVSIDSEVLFKIIRNKVKQGYKLA